MLCLSSALSSVPRMKLCYHLTSAAAGAATAAAPAGRRLEHGETVSVAKASSAYGRLSYTLRSSLSSVQKTIGANLTLPASFAQATAPPGGLILRLRAPKAAGVMASVTVGGDKWAGFDATAETVVVTQLQLMAVGMRLKLQDVVVVYK